MKFAIPLLQAQPPERRLKNSKMKTGEVLDEVNVVLNKEWGRIDTGSSDDCTCDRMIQGNSNRHPDGAQVRGTEFCTPPYLVDFILRLEASATSEDVWQEILGFANRLGLDSVDYCCASDFRNWERAQFIRTTFHSEWFEFLKQYPHIRQTSNFRMHGVNYLTPMKVGPEYIEDMGEISDEKRRHIELSAEMGLSAGIAIPLRSGEVGQAALISLGGRLTRKEFDAIWNVHGWTIHAAMLTAHARYSQLFNSEFVVRNKLTEKHKELIRLVGEGLMDKQIAHKLDISFSAVRQRLIAVQKKIGVQNRSDLVAVAARLGLVTDPLLRGHDDVLTVFLSTGDGKTGAEFPPYADD